MTSREEVSRVIEILKSTANLFISFKKTIENKNLVVLLGSTRSGKSTLGNYLMENTLYGIKERHKIFKIGCKNKSGPTIGQGSSSCTSVPVLYPLSAEIGMVDAPGFEDNRGVDQQILNAICNKQIKSAASIKFILVCDIADITDDNISNFLSSLNQLSKIVSNYQDLAQSFAVVFTKDRHDYTQEDVIVLFKDKILQQLQLVANKELVQNFVKNKQLIGIFKMPCKEGEITASDHLTVNIDEAIESCRSAPIDECVINLALPEAARNLLLKIINEYTDRSLFEEPVNMIIIPHKNYFNVEDYVFASYDDELEDVRSELYVIKGRLGSEIDKDLTRIKQIKSSLNILNVNINETFHSKLLLIINLDDFDLLEEDSRNRILGNYKQSLTKLQSRITTLIRKISTEEESRRSSFLYYKVGVGGIGVGAAGAAFGAASAFSAPSLLASAVVLGSATVCGIGLLVVGGVAYFRYRQIRRRNEVRRDQGRKLL